MCNLAVRIPPAISLQCSRYGYRIVIVSVGVVFDTVIGNAGGIDTLRSHRRRRISPSVVNREPDGRLVGGRPGHPVAGVGGEVDVIARSELEQLRRSFHLKSRATA